MILYNVIISVIYYCKQPWSRGYSHNCSCASFEQVLSPF